MFLCGIDRRDIIKVVNNFENKTPTYANVIDMCALKEGICSITKPLYFIQRIEQSANAVMANAEAIADKAF